MLRRVFMICASVVLLAAVYRLGATRAFGQSVSFRLIGANCAVVGGTAYYLEIGNPPLGWRQMPYLNKDLPPVPIESLISYENGCAVTDTGEGWMRQAAGWVDLGQLPGGTPAIRTSWGSVKATYK